MTLRLYIFLTQLMAPRRVHRARAVTMIEYALLASVAVGIIVAVGALFKSSIEQVFTNVENAL